MRTLLIRLLDDQGKTFVQETYSQDPQTLTFDVDPEAAILDLNHRLDVLERDGPWKPEVMNSLQPGPKEAA